MSNPNYPPRVTVDPSLEVISHTMVERYTALNGQMADHYAAFQPLQQPHIVSSHSAIMSTARAAINRAAGSDALRRAIVLGAGNCSDIPVAELARTFDTTTLVDIDVKSVAKAVANLPKRLHEKIDIIGADISGVAGDVAEVMEGAARRRSTYKGYLQEAAWGLSGIDPTDKQPDLGEGYAFVCSHLLLTQLGSIAVATLNSDLTETKYGVPFTYSQEGIEKPLTLHLYNLTAKLRKSHVDLLARLVEPSGTVHLADTYTQIVDGDMHTMVRDEELEYIAEQFAELAPPQSWRWQSSPNGEFHVVSNSLAPRGDTPS